MFYFLKYWNILSILKNFKKLIMFNVKYKLIIYDKYWLVFIEGFGCNEKFLFLVL